MAELNTLARPYARAAFEYAAAQDLVQLWSEALNSLGRLVADPELKNLLDHPGLAAQNKAELLAGLLPADSVSEGLRNFIGVVAEYGRLGLIEAIARQYDALKAAREKSLDLVVTSAYELTDQQREALSQALGKRLERKVRLETRTDAALLGGVYIQAGDTVIDASLRGRLAKLAQTMNS